MPWNGSRASRDRGAADHPPTRDIFGALAADQLAAEVIRVDVRLITPDSALLTYVWERRHNVSPDDATYLGLAARHGARWSGTPSPSDARLRPLALRL